jgi:hypothetical protein
MPYGLATLSQIEQVTKLERATIERLLDSLTEKGLVLDIWVHGRYHYTISPMVVGIFEFTMMRTRGELNMKEWGRLFHEYLQDRGLCRSPELRKSERANPGCQKVRHRYLLVPARKAACRGKDVRCPPGDLFQF